MDYNLTQRELEVLHAVAEHGYSYLAGEVLGISQQTVKNHITAVLRKTDSVTSIQAYHRLYNGRRLRRTETTTIGYEEIE